MRLLTSLLVVFTLAACNTNSQPINTEVLTIRNYQSFLTTDGCVKPPKRGGNVYAAELLAREINRRNSCVEFTDYASSANVILAVLVRDVRVADPDAPMFLFHHMVVEGSGELDNSINISLYSDYNLFWCWMKHNETHTNNKQGYTRLSLNQLRNDCR